METLPKIFDRLTRDFKNSLYQFDILRSTAGQKANYTIKLQRFLEKAHESDIRFLKMFENPAQKKQMVLTGSHDKGVKLWNLTEQSFADAGTYKHYKKVDGGFLAPDNSRFIFPDKTGDIFELELLQTGFSAPRELHTGVTTFIHFELMDHSKHNDVPSFVLAADDYHKIFVFHYPEMHNIMSILAPYRKLYAQFLDLYPHGVVGLHYEGTVDVIDYKSFTETEFVAKSHDLKQYFEGKNTYGLQKISDNKFLIIDDYFTVAIVIEIDPKTHAIQEKKFDLKQYNLVDNLEVFKGYKDVYVVKDDSKYLLVTETIFEGEPKEEPEVHNVDDSFTKIILKNIQVGIFVLGEL